MERGQMQHFGFAGASRWLMTKSIRTKIEYTARFYLHKNVDCRADKKITEIMPINDDGCRNGFYFWLNSEFWIRTASYFFLRILSKPDKKYGLPEFIRRSGLCVAWIIESHLFVTDFSIRLLLTNSRSQNVMIEVICSQIWHLSSNEMKRKIKLIIIICHHL